MSDLLPSAPRLFLKCGLLHRQVLGHRIPIFCVESLAVQLSVSGLLQGVVDYLNLVFSIVDALSDFEQSAVERNLSHP